MRLLTGVLVALVVIAAPAAQSPADVLSDTRLSVHTLVREDIFAGFRNDNLPRLERGERHIEILLSAAARGAGQPARMEGRSRHVSGRARARVRAD